MRVRIPGKIFFAGEYGALKGFPTLSVSVRPEFEFSTQEPGTFTVHPQSPAGRLPGPATWTGRFHDPYEKTGGLGRSTAEFLVKTAVLGLQHRDFRVLWDEYRSLHSSDVNPPSGVDLVTQILGGYCVTAWSQGQFERTTWRLSNLDWKVLLTGNKVKTHDHLRQLQGLNWACVEELNTKIIQSFESVNEEGFVKALREWRHYLLDSNLEVPTTTEIVEAMLTVPGVVAAKGCGALGSDAVLVVYESKNSSRVQEIFEIWNPKQVISSNQVSDKGWSVEGENLQFGSV